MHKLITNKIKRKISLNHINEDDRSFHDWYRFVLSFPPHLVRKYINDFNLTSQDVILDPFCGTGTTLVEAKINNIPSIGIEANPFLHFVSSTKINWNVDTKKLLDLATQIKDQVLNYLEKQNISDEPGENNFIFNNFRTLNQEITKLLLTNSISPLPLHKTLLLLENIKKYENTEFYNHLALAFANVLVYKASNLKFGPEVGVGKIKMDCQVVGSWYDEILKYINNINSLRINNTTNSEVYLADSRKFEGILEPESISAVITSPPYPNEKDYTRTTRLESVFLGFINSKEELRALKKNLIRSNTRNVYKEDKDDEYISDNKEIYNIAEMIENRRIELGKTSGFERLYPRVTKLYFGGMAKHLKELRRFLKPNAKLAYVVGDQASYLKVLIQTGRLIADIASSLSYEVQDIELFRSRFSTVTKEFLNEEVVILKWKG